MKDIGLSITADVAQPFSEMLKEYSRQMSAAMKPLSEAMKSLVDSIHKTGLELGKVLEQYGINERVAMKLLKKYKLFLSPSLDVRLVSDIARIGGKSGNHRGEINRLLAAYFGSNNFMELEELMKDWGKNGLFSPRMKILRDCLIALRNNTTGHNPTNVILPTLIAQIDGIRQCYLEKKGYSYKMIKTTNGGRRYVWVDSNGQNHKWPDVYKNTTAGSRYMAAACEIFVNVLFESSARGTRSLITFNRHKIMHGEYVRYGRIDNTLRAFLILDFLCYLK